MDVKQEEGKEKQTSATTTKEAPDGDDDTKVDTDQMKDDEKSPDSLTPIENPEKEKENRIGVKKSMETPSTQLAATSDCSSTLSLSLHDCISLGEIELGLERRQSVHTGNTDDIDDNNDDNVQQQQEYLRSIEEVRRLPYLLRILSSTRPLASIQSFVTSKQKSEGNEDAEKSEDVSDAKSKENDEYLDRIVDRLEDVAANYSVAGGIDVVTNHLAPSVAKNISRLPPLLKSRIEHKQDDKHAQNYEEYCWDTSDLAAVARDPIAKRKRRKSDMVLASNKKMKHDKAAKDSGTPDASTGVEDVLGTTSDEDEGIEMMDIAMDDMAEERRLSLKRRDSMIVAAEDSQESTVIKTLSELASLVVSSLDHRSSQDVEGEDDQQQHPGATSGGKRGSSLLSLNTDDILSEKAASIPTSGRSGAGHVGEGAIEGNDLSSTIVAIMHNAPVLQSRHVANALCRASVPQAGDLISRLGANCPASVSSLLLGCIEAYSMSIEYRHRDDNDGIGSSNSSSSKTNLSCPIVTAAKSAISAIARLSKKESCRVQNKLQSLSMMVDIQLKVAVEEGTMALAASQMDRETGITPVACLLIEHLSLPATTNHKIEGARLIASNVEATIVVPPEERIKAEGSQTPGDTNIDDINNKLIVEYAETCSKGGEPSLLLHFVLNPDLYIQTLDYFSQIMALNVSLSPSLAGSVKKCLGKWSLVLRACALLLLVPVPRCATTSDRALDISYNTCVESFVILLRNLTFEQKNNGRVDRPKTSVMDTLVGLLSSCAVLLLSRYLTIEDGQVNDMRGKADQAFQIMQKVFNVLRSTSEQSNMLRISIVDRMRKNDTWGVFKRTLYPLEMASNIQEHYANNSYRFKEIGLKRVCNMMHPVFEDMEVKIDVDVSFEVPFRLHVLRREMESSNKFVVEETRRFLGYILKEENEEISLSYIGNIGIARFVVEATNFLVKPGSTEIPLVLPAHIDIAWSRIASSWKISDAESTDGRRYNFLLQLLYAFIFLDKTPLSPFAFDPRSSPIKESLFMVDNIPSKATRNYLLSEIHALIRNHCPELTRHRFDQHLSLRNSQPFDTMDRNSILAALCGSIRSHFHESNPQLCESTVEQLFLLAKARICDSDVYSAVTNTFLSSLHAPQPTYSYHRLCRDPIVCLKFPLSVWTCRTLRRIALSILENLLNVNNVVTLEESRLKETAVELVAARDAIVVRCLLSVLHGGDSKHLLICSMTTSFIRRMIRSRPGLVALMVKQGLQERDLDWLVDNVPETINDSRYLLQIFSERNSLTGAERIVAADAAIRIAIVHGQGRESEAGQLILTAVSQLVDSFYLILGPIGLLPVDALFNAESGTSVTQISQKAAFRVLKALTKLRGVSNHFRRDCSLILQKLINLCKAELQGTVAGRRKQLVKELYDAAVKVEK